MRGARINSVRIIKGIFVILISLYLVLSTHMIRVSAETIDKEGADKYTLTLYEVGGVKEEIRGMQIGLKYTSDGVYYDETLLNSAINKLSCISGNSIFKSQSPTFAYENGSYKIYREVYGNSIDRNILYENIITAIKNKDEKIDLLKNNCYEKPKYTSDSVEVVNAKNMLNKYVSSTVVYNYAGLTKVLDGNQIKEWLRVDEKLQVIIDEAKVRSFVDNLANSYTSALGSSILVSGGYYGNNHSWMINSSEEAKALIENIKSGQSITKNPIYIQTAASSYFDSVGNTFVEIDMTKQHLWYYKDGYLIIEGDVVTGNVANGAATPEGVYKLYGKQKDTVLKGEDYASPVSFWMPFNKNIGLHDANWRTEFGGQIYLTDGSHGCVNAPYYLAKTVYENINIGTYVICHY
ncbi:L,D-transpeptidase family protein [Clostridium sp. C2-6-12]|uniref:L,D-transpeptidase family protein n=1 Tax=Clostridium sp. C2-6-12 TaxID=2698832 RepID=UPI00136F6C58|nr:L,D-transpeptidase family protein [Clostridium sp. C2-6-12]